VSAQRSGLDDLEKAIASLNVTAVKNDLELFHVTGESYFDFVENTRKGGLYTQLIRSALIAKDSLGLPEGEVDERSAEIVDALIAHGYFASGLEHAIMWAAAASRGFTLNANNGLAIFGMDNVQEDMEVPCSEGYTKLLTALLKAGVDPREPISTTGNPLYETSCMTRAVANNQTGVIRVLRSVGVPALSASDSIKLQFVEAVTYGNLANVPSMFRTLISAMVDNRFASEPDLEGMTPLQAATDMGAALLSPSMVPLLLQAGANPNIESPNSTWRYPIVGATWAAGYSSSIGYSKAAAIFRRIVNELLDAKAWVSVTDDKGNTALHYAAEYSSVGLAKALIANGAKVSPRNADGKTPLDLAVDGDIIKLLKENGAQEQ